MMTGLSIGAVGVFGMFGPFWAMPPQFLTGQAASAAFAIINSIGNLLGGFLGPKCFDYFDAHDKQNHTHTALEHGFLMAAPLEHAVMSAFLPNPAGKLAQTPCNRRSSSSSSSSLSSSTTAG